MTQSTIGVKVGKHHTCEGAAGLQSGTVRIKKGSLGKECLKFALRQRTGDQCGRSFLLVLPLQKSIGAPLSSQIRLVQE